MTAYAELQVTTNYSFLRGASHPEELVLTAAALGLTALAVTDRNTLAGVVRAHVAAKEHGLKLIVGARLDLTDAPSLLVYPESRAAYGRLSHLLTMGKRRAPKGHCYLSCADLEHLGPDHRIVVLPPIKMSRGNALDSFVESISQAHPGRAYVAGHNLLRGNDAQALTRLSRLPAPLVAVNDVVMHTPGRRPLKDVLTCIREHVTVDDAGALLALNAERHLKSAGQMAALFADHPEAIARTLEIAEACTFSLDELRYEYPAAALPEDTTPQEKLERLTWIGTGERYAQGLPDKVRRQIEHELAIIAQMDYAPYFLTVHDIVAFARSQGILCQGRGSAANSAVCYCLDITAVDPARADLLFERFISPERGEPPDIDVDFEHERREEVIQYIYRTYGRDKAGLAASVTTYKTRSAVREVGKALGLSQDVCGALVATVWGSSSEGIPEKRIREAGLDPNDARLSLALDLAEEIKGFPRHLSQHVGGFVLTRGPLSEVVPIENAAMEDRTVIEWDKDDLDALGILKIDVLALGMLSCLRKAFDLLDHHAGLPLTLATVPPEDPATYEMLSRGDSVGVFQVESRAQMSMLPRLKPRCFYDLVIEVAIVRPGPIQGDMVHPYLRRREGKERVTYPSPELERVLAKTMGVPLFQEQAMQVAIVGAGFAPAEADSLRRSMAAFRRTGAIHRFHKKFMEGMRNNGYPCDFAEQCFRQIEGFGEYGFPESHAASFALLVYVSAWLKKHQPAAFACALLNSQPMGFYAPAQIVRDAIGHGVEVRPPDINASEWDCTLEESSRRGGFALRLGLRQIKGFKEDDADAVASARMLGGDFADVHDLWRRSGLTASALELLAKADAFASLGLDRRKGLWAVRPLKSDPLPLFASAQVREFGPEDLGADRLPTLSPGEQVVEDYGALRLTLREHPLALLRARLGRDHGAIPVKTFERLKDGQTVKVAGLVTCRQRPGSARGILFITLEDETGDANLVVKAPVFEAHRREVLRSSLLLAEGRLQIEGRVIHVVVKKLTDLTATLRALAPEDDAPLNPARNRADRVKHNRVG